MGGDKGGGGADEGEEGKDAHGQKQKAVQATFFDELF